MEEVYKKENLSGYAFESVVISVGTKILEAMGGFDGIAAQRREGCVLGFVPDRFNANIIEGESLEDVDSGIDEEQLAGYATYKSNSGKYAKISVLTKFYGKNDKHFGPGRSFMSKVIVETDDEHIGASL